MDDAARGEHLPEAFNKTRRRKTFSFKFWLRIRKCDPDLRNFRGCKQVNHVVGMRADEGHIFYLLLSHSLGSSPEPGSLDINPDEVAVGVSSGETYSILSFTAAQFKCDGVVIPEEFPAPAPFHPVIGNQILVPGLKKV